MSEVKSLEAISDMDFGVDNLQKQAEMYLRMSNQTLVEGKSLIRESKKYFSSYIEFTVRAMKVHKEMLANG